jgi:hypothetical protein
MFSSLFWLVSTAFRSIGPDASLSRPDCENSTSVEALVAELRAELVPPPTAFPTKVYRTPPQAGMGISQAVLGARDTCSGNTNNYCFADSTSFCPSCGLCCTQAAGGWCCASTGVICCPAATTNGGSGCCYNWQLCESSGCVDPSYVIS